MGLAYTEQLSTGNVFAALMGFPTLGASSLLTIASILKFNWFIFYFMDASFLGVSG
jgi:hypothetical protein